MTNVNCFDHSNKSTLPLRQTGFLCVYEEGMSVGFKLCGNYFQACDTCYEIMDQIRYLSKSDVFVFNIKTEKIVFYLARETGPLPGMVMLNKESKLLRKGSMCFQTFWKSILTEKNKSGLSIVDKALSISW